MSVSPYRTHWNDYTALNAAVGVAAQTPRDIDLDRLRSWTEREGPAMVERFAEFQRRLSLALERAEQRPSPRREP